MKAVIGDTVLAQAPADALIKIEGNWYFPPSSITPRVLVESPTPYTCPWKGECQYYSVQDGDEVADPYRRGGEAARVVARKIDGYVAVIVEALSRG